MARKRFGIEFKGFEELIEKYDGLGGDIKKIAEKCLDIVPDIVNPSLEADMAKHNRSGRTERSLSKDQRVEWSGTLGKIPVGFKIKDGGLPSIFLMYGTARHAPANQYGGPKRSGARDNPGMNADRKLYNDIYGNAIKKKIGEMQEEILTEEIRKRMEGK